MAALVLLPPANLLELWSSGATTPTTDSVKQQAVEPKKKRLIAAAPESLSALRGEESLDAYNLEALKKIAKMGAVVLPRPWARATALETLKTELFGSSACSEGPGYPDEDEVHTVNLAPPKKHRRGGVLRAAL